MQRTLIWFLILIFFLAACRPQGSFKPEQAEETPVGDLVRRPLVVSFAELDANPRTYQNRLLRITGALVQVPPLPCARVNGPVPEWALVSEELRLNGNGFGGLLELVPEGTVLTVDGFWRRYRGPLGCGKEPPADTLWYLEAIRLVQPNPFPGIGDLLPVDAPAETLEPETTPTASPTPTATATGTSTPTATATASGTPPTVTPSFATTVPGATVTQTATPSPSATVTPGGTTTVTATQSPSPAATVDGAGTSTATAPTPTTDQSGYPLPTATLDPYD